MSFNYFTKEPAKPRYYPSELGIVRFSIKRGITKKYHSLINPGPLPLGHAYTSKEHSDKTHKLPLPPKALGEAEYDLILGQILELFIEERSAIEETLPVFVMESEMEMVETIVREFCDKSETDYDTIRILPLTFFFHKLRAAVDKVFLETESQFTYAIAQAHLERDNYQYYAGHGCRFHEVDDVNIHCALSRPTRWAYYIIDQAIGVTGGKKRAGFHFPKGCVIDEEDDSDDDEDMKPSVKKEEAGTEDYDGYTETSEIKVEKHEFNDDDSASTVDYRRHNGHNGRDCDTMSTASSRYELPRRPKVEDVTTDRRNFGYESESTTASSRYNRHVKEEDRDRTGRRSSENSNRSYATSVTQRSTNPFHEDNFPPLGAIPKSTKYHSRPHSSYQRLSGGDSDSDHSSDRRSSHKGRHQNIIYHFYFIPFLCALF